MASPTTRNPLDELVTGYPKLAGKMELEPETAIFRRFTALNARNLLYLQAELASLEKQLIEQECLDSADMEKRRYALDWYWLSQSRDQGDTAQLDLVLKIQATLEKYNGALIQQAAICKLEEPEKWDLRELQHFLETRKMGPLALIGEDATVWGSVKDPEGCSNDLVTLCPRHKEDPFSGWVAKKAILTLIRCGCARWKRPSRIHGVVGIQDKTIFRITLWFTTALASLIPLASIVALYYVHPIEGRLGIIGAFTLTISMCMGAFTGAKRSEIFAVSAAFTAVQVVFINTGSK